MLVVLRFRVPTAARSGFAAALRHLEHHLRGCSGLESLHVGTAVDDDELHTVVTTWDLPKSWPHLALDVAPPNSGWPSVPCSRMSRHS